MLYRVCRECDRLAQVRCTRYGAHHVMSSRSFRGKNTTGKTCGDGKSLRRERTIVFWSHRQRCIVDKGIP